MPIDLHEVTKRSVAKPDREVDLGAIEERSRRYIRRRRTLVALGGLALFVALGTAALGVRAWINEEGGVAAPSGDYLLLSDELGSDSAGELNGAVIVEARSNLPDGTKLFYSYGFPDEFTSGGSGCCPEVRDGGVRLRLPVDACPQSNELSLRVTASPDMREVSQNASCPPALPGEDRGCGPPLQPDSVLAELGQRFEKLDGPQVSQRDEVREIVVRRTYDLDEAGVCV